MKKINSCALKNAKCLVKKENFNSLRKRNKNSPKARLIGQRCEPGVI